MGMYKLPSGNQVLGSIAIETFSGLDFTNTPSKCALGRSPDAVNMTRVTPGKVGKRTGWEVLQKLPDAINGRHLLAAPDGETEFIHAGAKIYKWTRESADTLTEVYSGANDHISTSAMLGGELCFFDGFKLLLITESSVEAAEVNAKVPKTVTGRSPTGGGVVLEPVNLLTPKRYEGFYGTADATVYELSSGEITAVEKVEKLNSAGTYETVAAAAYTVDEAAGKVTFAAAPGVSPADGKDNILIYYSKTVTGYADRVNKSTMCALYGINGGQNRIFCTGAPNFVGRDCFSEIRDPRYWGDLWYGALGDENTPIINYAIVSNRLATFKSHGENNVNVFLREGKLEKVTEKVNDTDIVYYDPAFEVTGTYQSEEVVAPNSFQIFNNEPIFLTKRGIHALTLISFTSERNSELRSYYLNGDGYRGLLTESNPENACSAVWNGFYVLCLNGHCYLLDSLQTVLERGSIDSNSKKQYEGFYWENVPAVTMWEHSGELYFGTSDGRICRFRKDTESTTAYMDGDDAVTGYWCTANLRGKYELSSTTIISVGYVISAFMRTGIDIYVSTTGHFKQISQRRRAYALFAYEPFDYGAFSYSGDSTEQTYNQKVRFVRKADKFQFRFENNDVEPFAIERFEVDYRQGGKFKNRG